MAFTLASALLWGKPSAAESQAFIDGVPTLGYRVVKEWPHDTTHFTQGLEIHEGKLFESAGGYGRSSLTVSRLRDGKILHRKTLPSQLFAEGLTIWNDLLVLLTWREQQGLVFDLKLRKRAVFPLRGEGWGVARLPWQGADHLVISDGSSVLRIVNPATFEEVEAIEVRNGDAPIERLNELEYAESHLYANVWQTDRVAVLRPEDGRLLAWIDFAALKERLVKPAGWRSRDHVLNGIAYDPATGHFFLTGKCWPILYEVEIDRIGG